MRRPVFAAAFLLVSACGAEAPQASPSAEDIRRLTHMPAPEEKPRPFRLGTLGRADIPPRFQGSPRCRLTRGGETLLVARDGAAFARIDGRLAAIAQAGPVDATGAFFRGPDITISVGGHDPRPIAAAPAGVTITGPGDAPPQKVDGTWGCG